MTTTKLNIKDKQILKILDSDARQSNSQIAKKTRLSKNIVNYQIKRLEQLGLIKKYLTLIDYSRLGYFQIRTYLDFYELDPDKEEKLIQYLIKCKSTGSIARTVGDWDLSFTIFVKNLGDFEKEWSPFINKFRSIIKEYSTQVITKEIAFERTDLTIEKKEKSFWEKGSNQVIQIDSIDSKILNLIVENARIPIKHLSLEIGLGSMAIIYRLKQLVKKGIILGYRANLDFTKLGYEYYKINLELENPKIINALTAYCKSCSNVVSVTHSIHDNVDFEFDIEVKDFNVLLDLISQLKKQFPRSIRDYTYIKFVKYYKKMSLPCL